MKMLLLSTCTLFLAGCNLVTSPALQEAQTEASRKPVGAWVGVHHKDWNNGVEVVTLNSRTGQVCSVFFSNDTSDKPDRVTDQIRCQSVKYHATD